MACSGRPEGLWSRIICIKLPAACPEGVRSPCSRPGETGGWSVSVSAPRPFHFTSTLPHRPGDQGLLKRATDSHWLCSSQQRPALVEIPTPDAEQQNQTQTHTHKKSPITGTCLCVLEKPLSFFLFVLEDTRSRIRVSRSGLWVRRSDSESTHGPGRQRSGGLVMPLPPQPPQARIAQAIFTTESQGEAFPPCMVVYTNARL